MHRKTPFRAAGVRLLALGLAFALAACSDTSGPTSGNDGISAARGGVPGPDLRAATAAKNKHVDRLIAQAGVEGVGVSLSEDGKKGVVMIFTTHGAVGGLPRSLDGVPVRLRPTGKIYAGLPPQAKGGNPGGPGGGGGSADPTGTFPRPVPIGVSIGNVATCSAGTLGALVTQGSNFYILSNNHVLAEENEAPIGSDIIQPGRFDTDPQCSTPGDSKIGDLADFVPISFSGNNTVDAAIASTTTGDVGTATFSGGYGEPNSTTSNATIGMAVQKCGRTTSCTRGSVTSINATINVQYSSGVARFVNQVVIDGRRGAFSKAGDSGSLIVTDNSSANPVALLFAGSNTITIGNPINAVLSALGVQIDGK
ncbi:MAG TPA: hypothetical protein VFS94_05115 [Gemmatimonadales bacterium]|nr:hypothetical protein [Gemmatimonadales bacterium]